MSTVSPRIRTGIDLVEVPQVREMLREHPAFETRVFSDAERTYCSRYPDPAPHLAARLAAKEATLKALGMGITPLGIDAMLGDIEVQRVGSAPELLLRGRPAAKAAQLGVTSTSVSLSHAGASAIASVVLLAENPI
jgi:holo-[acyl-carrier protein] synthase